MYRKTSWIHPALVGCAAAATLLLAFPTAPAWATIVDFEDVAVVPQANIWGDDLISQGYFFDSLANHTHRDRDDFRVANGTTYLGTDDAPGYNPLIMFPVGNGPFKLSQLDLAEWSNENTTSRTVTVTGHYYNGGTIVRNINLDLIFDGVGGAADFQTFTFTSVWTNLESVWFKGSGALNTVGGNNYFTLDNIVVTMVPEPTALAMLAVAAMCRLGFVRQRRG